MNFASKRFQRSALRKIKKHASIKRKHASILDRSSVAGIPMPRSRRIAPSGIASVPVLRKRVPEPRMSREGSGQHALRKTAPHEVTVGPEAKAVKNKQEDEQFSQHINQMVLGGVALVGLGAFAMRRR